MEDKLKEIEKNINSITIRLNDGTSMSISNYKILKRLLFENYFQKSDI